MSIKRKQRGRPSALFFIHLYPELVEGVPPPGVEPGASAPQADVLSIKLWEHYLVWGALNFVKLPQIF